MLSMRLHTLLEKDVIVYCRCIKQEENLYHCLLYKVWGSDLSLISVFILHASEVREKKGVFQFP